LDATQFQLVRAFLGVGDTAAGICRRDVGEGQVRIVIPTQKPLKIEPLGE
jgi:hypothetical protein